MCEFSAMNKIEEDIKELADEILEEKVYELQMTIDQMVCDICSDGHESVVKAIRKKYGDEMADQFDKNSDIEDMIDYKLRSEVCL